jgi:hypothetical protein
MVIQAWLGEHVIFVGLSEGVVELGFVHGLVVAENDFGGFAIVDTVTVRCETDNGA